LFINHLVQCFANYDDDNDDDDNDDDDNYDDDDIQPHKVKGSVVSQG